MRAQDLTPKQLEKAEKIMEATRELRRKVTLYKKGDPNMALFRIEAMNMIQEAVLRQAVGVPYSKKLEKHIEYWELDSGIGKDITALFRGIEEATNG